MSSRVARYVRETRETRVEVELNIDERGEVRVETPIRFLNHMLATMLYYMNSTSTVIAEDRQGYDDHHVVEDIAIALGEAFREALGDKRGIRRFANAIVPMDDALVLVAVDISGRGVSNVELRLRRSEIGGLATENIPHFLQAFSYHSGVNLHVIQLRGSNTHHILEAAFKALGISLYEASRVVSKEVPSLKGVL